MSTTRKRLTLNNVTVSLGCGSCRRPKLLVSRLFNPKHRPKSESHRKHTTNHYHFCSSSCRHQTEGETEMDAKCGSMKMVRGFGQVGGESVAVEKESDDPYLDFRQSMLQMILEKEIYSKDDMRELLNCFLQLNSPYYHGVIVRAFTEIWNGVFSVKPSGG
ncbi:hypothetical protein SLA2020_527890 [Shorea laevis]